jgi:hypothetical protein
LASLERGSTSNTRGLGKTHNRMQTYSTEQPQSTPRGKSVDALTTGIIGIK